MRLKIVKTIILFTTTLLFLINYSLKKEEGEVGKASIPGIVKERIYDTKFKVLQADIVGSDVNVYIVYDNDQTVGDDTIISATGAFEFEYLMPWNYTLYVYSEDSANNNTKSSLFVSKSISISKSDQTVGIGNILRYKITEVDNRST